MNDIAKARKVVEGLTFIRETLKDTNKRRKVLNMQLGICGMFSSATDVDTHTHSYWRANRRNAFRSWSKFSDDVIYPVPHKDDSPEVAYDYRQKWVGQYGKDRIELLEHLIAYFEDLATIKLSNLAEASEQQVFDQVSKHLLAQNKRSTVAGSARCLYLNARGLMCAAGCLIGDDETARRLDNTTSASWVSLVSHGMVTRAHCDLINTLQDLHDNSAPEYWHNQLGKVANEFNLKFTF